MIKSEQFSELSSNQLSIVDDKGNLIGEFEPSVSSHTWFVVDGEMNGKIAGINALLSVGVTACSELEILGKFEVNIKPFHGSVEDPETMAWWATIPEQYEYVTRNALPPSVAMRRFADFVKGFSGEPVFVGCPMGFDFSWVDWYQKMFLPEVIFNDYCFDLVTAVHIVYGFDVTSRSPEATLNL